MINAPTAIRTATTSSSRSPTARLNMAWDRSALSVEWFRLDQSSLDSGAILTFTNYANNTPVQEIITNIDKFRYADESDYLISAEGLDELRGDNYQSVAAEADVVLDNTTGRFTPRSDKNLLSNPSFESNFDNWNLNQGTGGAWATVGSGTNVVSGVQALRFQNLSASATANVQSDIYPIATGLDYTGSLWARGTGNLLLEVVALGSGNNPISSGITSFALASGTFARFSRTFTMPATSTSAYLRFKSDNGVIIVDNAQLERSSVATSYNYDFIGDLILPKRPGKIQIQMLDRPNGSGGTVPRFAGLTENAEPNLKGDTMHLHLLDYSTELLSKQAMTNSSGMGMYSNLPSHILIRELALKGGLTDSDLILESGRQNIPFAWFQEGSVWYYMQLVAEAEGGRVFFDESGVLNFWNRDHLDTVSYVSGTQHTFTFNDWVTDLNYRVDKDEIKNHIVVKSEVREVQSNQQVWSLESPLEIPANSDVTLWANINDTEGHELPLTGLTQPTATGSTSFYTANSVSDGSGTDQTSLVDLTTWSAFATAAKMIFHSRNSQSLYLTKVVIYGTPAKITKHINVEVQDDASMTIYGDQLLQIENNYISSEAYALNLANDRLYNLKNPLTKIRSSVIGVPYLQIGDLVRIENGYNGEFYDLFVRRNRWQLLEGGEFTQDLLLESRTIASYFTLDQSVLDGTDILSV